MIVARKGRILELSERIDPAHTALLVVDVQNDFFHADGVFGQLGYDLSAMDSTAGRIERVIGAAREAGLLIVFIRASYDEVVLGEPLAETFNRRGHADSHCLEGGFGSDWYGSVRPTDAPNEVVVTKHRFSGIWGTDLDLYLRSNGIRTVVITGMATSGCIDSTARDAFFLNYHLVFAEDCCADASPAQHQATMAVMDKVFGTVVDSETIERTWRGAASNQRHWRAEAKSAKALSGLEEKVAPEHTALVLVDLQNDLCEPDGALGRRGKDLAPVQRTRPAIARLADMARSAGAMVIHVRTEQAPLAQSDAILANVGAEPPCLAGSRGAGFVEGMAPTGDEPVVVKHRTSPFPDSRLELLLRSNGIRTVIVAGAGTESGVESTVRDAHNKDFYVVVPVDCVATDAGAKALHEASLEIIARHFGEVAPSARIVQAWTAAGAAG